MYKQNSESRKGFWELRTKMCAQKEIKQDKEKFTTDVLVRLLTKLLLRARGLISLPVVAKTLGASKYGIWTQLFITSSFLKPVLSLRLESACVRYLSSEKGKSKTKGFFSMLESIMAMLGFVSVILLLLRKQVTFLMFNDKELTKYIGYFTVLLIMSIFSGFLLNYYRTFSKIKTFSSIQIISSFSSIALLVLMVVYLKQGLIGAILSSIFVNGAISLWVFFDIVKDIGFSIRIDFKKLVSYLKYTIPLIPNSFLFLIINSSDRYIIAYFLDLKEVGIYSASYSLGQLASFFLTPISFVLFPVISRLWEQNKLNEVRSYMENSLKYYFFLAVPCVFGIYYLAPILLSKLATQEFVTSRILVLFIVLGFFLIGIYQIYLYTIHLKEKTKYLPFVFLTIASLNLILNFLMVPKIGIMGAAFSTFLCYLLQAVIIYAFSNSLFSIHFNLKFLLKTVASSVIMFLAMTLFSPHGLIGAGGITILGGFIYLSFMVLFRGIGKKEYRLAKSAVRGIVCQ